MFTNPSTDNNSQTHLLSAPVTLHLQSDSKDHHQLLQLFDEEGKADSAMVCEMSTRKEPAKSHLKSTNN